MRRLRKVGPPVLVLVVLIAWPTLAAGDGGPTGLTIEDLARMHRVSDLATAPSGGRVAYLLSVPRIPFVEDDGPAWHELHVLEADGSSRPLVTGHQRIEEIAWTPDGRSITFLSERHGSEHPTLWRLPIDGGEARPLLDLGHGIVSYEMAPDGRRLAVLVARPSSDEREALEEAGFTQEIFEEDVSPVELWIATGEGWGDEDPAANPKGVAEASRQIAIDGSVRGMRWSPGGDRLVVEVSPTSLVDDTIMRTRLRVIDAASGEVVARFDNPGKLGDVAWSPEGHHLAMISAADLADPREGRLMVVAAEGGEPRDLMPALEAHVGAFAWRDAKTLLALVRQGVETWVAEVPLAGGGPRVLVPTGGPLVEDLSLGADGTLAVIASTPRHDSELYRLEEGELVRRTESNPWLASRRLAPQEIVRWKARDGLELEGLLIRPMDEREGERHPLVMVVHGGPEAHNANGWLTSYSRPGQVLAARGVAVFYPNYRASTGRGVAFSKLDHYDPGGKEFDDLVDGVDHLIANGLVDGERVGVTGGSYGGYATAWCATYFSHRFAAAVMSVGITDKIFAAGAADIPTELYHVHLREWPWENWDHYAERSPIRHVEKHRTPLLIAHGTADTRVHPGNSLVLYRFLKILDQAPVRLIWYPGERHGNRRAASRLDFSLRLVRWMEHYLLGEGGEKPAADIDYPRFGTDEGVEPGTEE